MRNQEIPQCNPKKGNDRQCQSKVKSIFRSLRDSQGKRIKFRALLKENLLNSKQRKFEESETIVNSEKCDKVPTQNIKKVIGAVSKIGFKKTFKLSQRPTAKFNPQILITAAKNVVSKDSFNVFNSSAAKWYKSLKPSIKAISEGKSLEDIKAMLKDKGLSNRKITNSIYGKKGVLNFLLAVSRINDVFCRLTSADNGKVALAIGARASVVVTKKTTPKAAPRSTPKPKKLKQEDDGGTKLPDEDGDDGVQLPPDEPPKPKPSKKEDDGGVELPDDEDDDGVELPDEKEDDGVEL